MIKLNVIVILLFGFLLNAQEYDFVVAKDGSGNFKTVQEAINAVPHLRKKRTIIFIKEGIYKEKLILPSTKTNVSLIGENIHKTILTYNDYASKLSVFGESIGTSGSSSFFICADGFEAAKITFENSSGDVGQAVAVRIDGDRVKFENCKFLGYQDTLYLHGKDSRQYYKSCYIEGSVDFIFGGSVGYFENCEIYSKNSGYLTAASTQKSSQFGFVFKNCNISGSAKKESVYLGRPWRPFSNVVFISCKMSQVIITEGWGYWGRESNKKSAYYAEYNSTGKGGTAINRVKWSHLLSEKAIKKYSLKNVLGDWDPNKQNNEYEIKK